MEVDGSGYESAAAAPGPGRGKKRSHSPATPPSDGEDSSMSTSSDEDDDGWTVSDSGSDEEDEEGQGTCHPFTVDDFPRISSDHSEQIDARYQIPEIRLRGPLPLPLFRAFKDPVIVNKGMHCFGSRYRLYDESEITVNNVGTIDCSNRCRCYPMDLLQFIDLKIAGYRHAQPGRAKIFGFFAARDYIEPLRNYVYRREIDNYEAVSVKRKTGMARLSLTGPARGICMTSHVLFEFKLCIRTEDMPEDEPKADLLIEGCTEFTDIWTSESYVETRRMYGEKCALDLKFAVLINAVQAKIDVEILHAPACGLNLKLYAKTSGLSNVIRLFRGVAEVGCRTSSIVAVMTCSYLDLCMEGSPKDDGLCQKLSCDTWKNRFDPDYHATVGEVVKLGDVAIISVKVTWRAVDSLRPMKG